MTEKDVKRVSLILLVAGLAILVFLVLRPVVMSILTGLILAYVFFPIYRWLAKLVRSKTLSASIVSIFILLLIIVPLWFLIPMLAKQVFELFQISQKIDYFAVIKSILPTASDQIINQLTLSASSASGKISGAVMNSLMDFLIDFPKWSLHLLITAFVFFFTLRDSEIFKEFVSGLSPLNKTQEKHLINQFEGITKSIIYGYVVVGLIQGLFAGLGFIIFGVSNAFVLTILCIILAIIPVIGPPIIYIPIAILMFINGNSSTALIFLAYNLFFVSTMDNFLRTLIIAKKTSVSQVIVLIGMIGGFFLFGLLGLIIGPLILSYFITFLKAYKEKTLSSLFADND